MRKKNSYLLDACILEPKEVKPKNGEYFKLREVKELLKSDAIQIMFVKRQENEPMFLLVIDKKSQQLRSHLNINATSALKGINNTLNFIDADVDSITFEETGIDF